MTQDGNFDVFGDIKTTSTTMSDSTTSGALVVGGGAGIGGSLYAGDIFSNGVKLTNDGSSQWTTGTDASSINYRGMVVINDISATSGLPSATNGSLMIKNNYQSANSTSSIVFVNTDPVYDGTDYAYIKYTTDRSSDDHERSRLIFGIKDNVYTNNVVYDCISFNANVGILNDTPTCQLDVNGRIKGINFTASESITGASVTASNHYINNINSGTNGFAMSNNSSYSDAASNKMRILNNNSTSYFDFASSSDAKLHWRYGSINAEFLTFDGSYGRVGINEPIPACALDVQGSINCTGSVMVNGTPIGTNGTNGINSPWVISGTSDAYLNGSVAIGQTNIDSTYKLKVVGKVSADSYNATSDYRLKQNVQLLNETNKSIDELKPIEYDLSGGNHDMGFLAHEVQEIFPFLVNGEKDGKEFQSINYNGFIALLVKEIQDLKKEMKILHNKNDELDERNDELDKRLKLVEMNK